MNGTITQNFFRVMLIITPYNRCKWFINTHTHTQTHTDTHTHTHTHTHTSHKHTHTLHTHTSIQTQTQIHTDTHTSHTNTHITHTHTHTSHTSIQTHTHTHTHTHDACTLPTLLSTREMVLAMWVLTSAGSQLMLKGMTTCVRLGDTRWSKRGCG